MIKLYSNNTCRSIYFRNKQIKDLLQKHFSGKGANAKARRSGATNPTPLKGKLVLVQNI